MSSLPMVSMASMARRLPSGSGAAEVVAHLARHDLPGDAEAVLEPAAGAVLTAALDERLPVAVDLGLVGAVDLEGDGLGEGELRAAVERREGLTGDA